MPTTKAGRSYSQRLELGCRLRGIEINIITGVHRNHTVLIYPPGADKPLRFGTVFEAWEHYVAEYAHLPVAIQ